MANAAADNDFNSILFEKKLTNLKDSQESINTCCHWCLENRQHHKKIVNAWLNVLKRVKVEHRLTLFYLANDVIQYSKRRNYEFVESWGTTLQKATTMVRDEKVKHKILRIFKIWEQRGVYGEEFITDLSGLISATPTSRKSDEPHEFQSSYLVTKIRNCAKLESDTDLKLKKFKEHNPKVLEGEALCSSLKDRAHVDDVEKEMDDYVMHMEEYVNALKIEIKARNNLISLLTQAELQLDNDKKDVKLVANAYKTFASRVKTLKKRLDEIKPTLISPIPSPDINAPSPSPDSDIDLPNTETTTSPAPAELSESIYTNAGFYNPVPPPITEPNSNFLNNGFTSFMGTNMPFNIQNVNATLFNNTSSTPNNASQTQTTDVYSANNSISSLFPPVAQPPPPPTPVPAVATTTTDYQYGAQQIPLMPPPIPPFSKTDTSYVSAPTYTDGYSTESSTNYGNSSYDHSSAPYPNNNTSYQTSDPTYHSRISSYETSEGSSYQSSVTNYQNPPYDPPISDFQNPPFPGSLPVVASYTPAEEYNPEEEPETWESETNWDQPPVDLETPESPPMFEKEGYGDPVEYHDNQPVGSGVDIDHRVLTILPTKDDLDNEVTPRKKDVDHRNLISLTGSPKQSPMNLPNAWNSQNDQDYRSMKKSKDDGDQDYRTMPFTLENLKLPPPPPPPNQLISPNKIQKKHGQSPRKVQDNVESIDMDLSDDDIVDSCNKTKEVFNENLRVITIVDDTESETRDLEPPPPFPEFSDDADANANNLLDDLNNDLDDPENLISDFEDEDLEDLVTQPPPEFHENFEKNFMWNNGPPIMNGPCNLPPGPPGPPGGLHCGPPMNMNIPPPMPNMNWNEPIFHQEFGFRGRAYQGPVTQNTELL